jgi:branched-chain amino acid transport system ATP-binding protein
MSVNCLLRGEKLVRSFGGIKAVQGVDIEVTKGEFRSIVGPNGAGKTTLFNMLARQLNVSSGNLWFNGRHITHVPSHALPKLGIARTFQKTSLFPTLTIRENVRLAVQAKVLSRLPFLKSFDSYPEINRRTQELIDLARLSAVADRLVGETSHGDHRLTEIAVALGSDPMLLLLDEPMAGMSATEAGMTIRLLKELKGTISIVFIEHDMDAVLELSDRVTVMDLGRVIADGPAEAVQNDPAVKRAYLGTE